MYAIRSYYECWNRECKSPDDAIERFKHCFEFGGHKSAIVAIAAKKFKLYLVSKLPEDKARTAFFTPMASVQEALSAVLSENPDAKIHLMPHGGQTVITSYSIHYTKLYERLLLPVALLFVQGKIHLRFLSFQVTSHGGSDPPIRYRSALVPRQQGAARRITSYNVCYTKLLRAARADSTSTGYRQ